MKTVFLMLFLFVMICCNVSAHLCNDVFEQAKDDLAVKVDIRDGQLRVNKEASFRVYLMNTMDRDIADINLKVESDAFDVKVEPSKTWKKFPVLRTTRKGGQKEFFEVTLKRKPNLPDGKYNITMTLFNGRDASMIFKTLNLEEAADVQTFPVAPKNVVIDGNITREEWEHSFLLTDFYTYERQGRYYFSSILKNQPRIRMMVDSANLYISANVEENTEIEILTTADRSSAPKSIKINLDAQKIEGITSGIIKKGKDGTEIRIPLSAIGHKNNEFFMNVILIKGQSVSYWRGNAFSYKDPLIFATISTSQKK